MDTTRAFANDCSMKFRWSLLPQCDMAWHLSCSSFETSCHHCAMVAMFPTMSSICTPPTMGLVMFALSKAYVIFICLCVNGDVVTKKCTCPLLPIEILCTHHALNS